MVERAVTSRSGRHEVGSGIANWLTSSTGQSGPVGDGADGRLSGIEIGIVLREQDGDHVVGVHQRLQVVRQRVG